jgi:cathepsin K
MRRALFCIATLLICSAAIAQELKLPESYRLREQKAPQSVKNKIEAAKKEIKTRNLQFIVSYTSVADLPIEKITGLKKLTPDESRQLNLRMKKKLDLMRAKEEAENKDDTSLKGKHNRPTRPVSYPYGNPSMASLDLRDSDLVTGVREQGSSGTCWAFCAMAAYETSYKKINDDFINASEQYLINCSGAGNASAGWMAPVFDWMVDNSKNVDTERSTPYTGTDGRCRPSPPQTDYFADSWGAVDPSGDLWKIPTVAQIKEAICRHGAVVTALYADQLFQLYSGGVFFSFPSGEHTAINHGVTIIGWNDSLQAWLIKNSWGGDWGSDCGKGSTFGYMWIKYNSSNIGVHSIWIRAKKSA